MNYDDTANTLQEAAIETYTNQLAHEMGRSITDCLEDGDFESLIGFMPRDQLANNDECIAAVKGYAKSVEDDDFDDYDEQIIGNLLYAAYRREMTRELGGYTE